MKSFRAAADRIVRQESAISASAEAQGLLSSVAERARSITNEQDAWDARLAALSALGTYDALAVMATAPVRLAQSHNIADPRVLHEAIVDAADEAKRRGAAVQLRTPTILADGRSASEIMVVPLIAVEGVEGVLVALRVGRGFSATDAVTASSVGTDVALEVTRAALGQQDARTRRQALALFELARAGLGPREFGERLHGMVEIVAKSFGHEVAQLWLLRDGGSLRLRAAYPAESLVLEIARPRDHAGLARSLEGEVVQVNDVSLRSWIRSRTRDLIIAPLRDDRGVHGLLALGRSSERYLDDDLEMAAQCADFFERIVAADAGAAREHANANEAESA